MDELPTEIDPAEVQHLMGGVTAVSAVGFPTAEDEVKRLIDPVAVEALFMDCLFREGDATEGAVVVEGVITNFGFHPDRLASHRDEIRATLALLPIEFQSTERGGGGGWSFLNACVDKNGTLWTGLHRRVEQLLTLGIGLGFVTWQLPRDFWSALPGGVPYLEITI